MGPNAFIVVRRGEDKVLMWEMGVEWAQKKLDSTIERDKYLASDNKEVALVRQEHLVLPAKLQLAITDLEPEKAQEVQALLVKQTNLCCELFVATREVARMLITECKVSTGADVDTTEHRSQGTS